MAETLIAIEWFGYTGLYEPFTDDMPVPDDLIHTDQMPPIPAPFQRWKISGFGAHQFVSDYWLKEYNKNPSMDHLIVTMELVFGDDKSIFVATRPMTVTSELLGNTVAYLGIVQDFPAIGFNASITTQTSSARSFSMAVPNEFVDAISLVKAGRMLAGVAEVSLQVDGGDYDERFVIMRGSMDSGVQFGDTDGEMVEVSITDPKDILSQNLPPYKVPEKWPSVPGAVVPFYFADPINYVLHTFGTTELHDTVSEVGGFSGRAYPPAAGVGRTYPIVWGHWPRVPCVPLVRQPYAKSSEFGSKADKAYKDFFGGLEEYADHCVWYVVAYGHGHWFHDPSSPGGRYAFTVNQINASYEDTFGVHPSEADSSTGGPDIVWEWFGFYFYVNDEIKHSSTYDPDLEHSSAYPWYKTCVLMEVSDPNGVPITVLQMWDQESGFDYSESVQIPMISALGNEPDQDMWGGHSIISCLRFFAKSFTTLGSSGIDDALFAKAQARLGSYNVRGIVNGSGEASQAQTISWIETELLKAFPMVSMTFTGNGYGPVVIDNREMVSGDYTVGQWGITSRTTSIQETPKTQIFNDFTINFGYDHESNSYNSSVRRNSGNSIACQVSEAQCGKKTSPVIETMWIHDSGVAEYCVDWLCEHLTMPYYYVEYAADVWMMFKHQVGDNIKLTDPSVGFDGVVSTILKIEYTGDQVNIGLAVWERYSTLGGGAASYPEPRLDPPSSSPAEPQD